MNCIIDKKRVSIVVPCYNEEKILFSFHKELWAQLQKIEEQYESEIIYINDGSRDGSQKRIEEIASQIDNVKYISFSRNFGKESAMLAGLESASGDCVILMDADLQHPPELIPDMLRKYEAGFDQVIAKRDRKGDSHRSVFFARCYYWLAQKLIDVKLEDGAGDFRLLSRKAVDAVLELKETNRFSKGLFSWIGFSQTYIEYSNRQRLGTESRWSFKQLFRYGIDSVISFNVQPLRMCVYMGAALLAISMLYLIYLFVEILMHGIDVPGYFTTIAMIAIIGGVQLISLGIIGEYVGRIYAEVKKRPAYIIEKSNIGNDNEVDR